MAWQAGQVGVAGVQHAGEGSLPDEPSKVHRDQ